MKRFLALFLLVASLSTVAFTPPLYSQSAPQDDEESEFLTTSWFSDANELCMTIEFEEGLAFDSKYTVSRSKKGGVLGCEVTFAPVAGATVVSSSGDQVTKITMEIMLDTQSNPFEGARTITTDYLESDGETLTETGTIYFTLDPHGISLDFDQDPTLYSVVDDNNNPVNECMICFAKLIKKSGKKK